MDLCKQKLCKFRMFFKSFLKVQCDEDTNPGNFFKNSAKWKFIYDFIVKVKSISSLDIYSRLLAKALDFLQKKVQKRFAPDGAWTRALKMEVYMLSH